MDFLMFPSCRRSAAAPAAKNGKGRVGSGRFELDELKKDVAALALFSRRWNFSDVFRIKNQEFPGNL